MRLCRLAIWPMLGLLATCGPSPAEQAAMDAAQQQTDQQQCSSFGLAPGTDAFARCRMDRAAQREAQAAASRRAQAAQAAANQRAADAARADRERAEQQARDQAQSASPSSTPSSSGSSSAAQDVIDRDRAAIQEQMDKAQGN